MGQLSVSLFKHTPKIFWYFQKFKTSERLSFNIQSTFQYLWRLFISPQKTFFTPSCKFHPLLHVYATIKQYRYTFQQHSKPIAAISTRSDEYPTSLDEYPTSFVECFRASSEIRQASSNIRQGLTNIQQALTNIRQGLTNIRQASWNVFELWRISDKPCRKSNKLCKIYFSPLKYP